MQSTYYLYELMDGVKQQHHFCFDSEEKKHQHSDTLAFEDQPDVTRQGGMESSDIR